MPLTVLLAGASRGIGAAFAQEIAKEDPHCDIYALARTSLARLAAVMPDTVSFSGITVDVATAEGVAAFTQVLGARQVPLRCVLWTASASYEATPALLTRSEQWSQALVTGVQAPLRLCYALTPFLDSRGAAVIVPVASWLERPYFSLQAAVQGATLAALRVWASETANLSLHVVDLPPVATGFRHHFFPGEPRQALLSATEAAQRLISHWRAQSSESP